MKRIISILLACLMLVSVLAFAGCRKDEGDATDGTKAVSEDETLVEKYGVKLMNEGKLTIGCEAAYPPFEMQKEDGSYAGYDIDLAYAIAEKLGVEVEIINTGFDGILDGIGTNYDCVISALTIMPERLETVDFTTPYIQNFQAVVALKGTEADITEFADLNGSTISLQNATTSHELLGELNDNGTIEVSIIPNEHVSTCFAALSNGEVDYVVCDSTVAADFLLQNPDKYEILFTDSTEPEEFAIAVGKGDTALLNAMNDAMAQLKEEGFFEDNYETWFADAE